ncbi:MAG: hypothetical protein IKN57_03185, partial [Parasporobacterium sp.]|nr:hypothetical protein [Parasporobacterium sp.]
MEKNEKFSRPRLFTTAFILLPSRLFLLLAACILLVIPCTPAKADSASGRKIVSIVFDDSWSMSTENRYSNANYAMQAFIALLDEEDELYVVYMSDVMRAIQADPSNTDPAGLAVRIGLEDPQAGADQVRAKPWNGAGTPYSSVQVGYNELFNHPDPESSTSYYLVVMSDGGFMDDVTNSTAIETGRVQALFESFAQKPMPNGTMLNTYYLAIGNEAVPLTDRPDLNFHAFTTTDGLSMIRAIGQMADMISGRYRLDPSEILQTAGNVVSVTSPLPLRNIAFLSQGRAANVAQILGPDGVSYPITRNVTLSPDAYNGDASLFGDAILADNGAENMPSGTYTVTFTSDIDLSSLTVMFEPALSYELVFSTQGIEIPKEAVGGLLEGQELTVSGRVVETGTQNP